MDVTETIPQGTEEAKQQPGPQMNRRKGRVELSIHEIIDRAEDPTPKFMGTLLWSCIAGFLLYASYAPLAISPLSWVAPLPWLLMIRAEQPCRRLLFWNFVGGLCFTVPVLQWMRYGHPLMYIGWGALAVYLAALIPIFIGLTRTAVHRYRWPLFIAAPVIWTGIEYFRGFFFTGFGWYYLGHTQVQWLSFIQISDLVGAYGVSFVMMLVTAAIATAIPQSWLNRMKLTASVSSSNADNGSDTSSTETSAAGNRVLPVGIALSVLAVSCVYGMWRLSAAQFTPGPRVALIQGNFKAQLQVPASEYEESFLVHSELTGMAVSYQPDLIVWPEGMFRYSLFDAEPGMTDEQLRTVAPYWAPEQWKSREVQHTLTDLSQKAGAAMVIGLSTFAATPDDVGQYNSAQFITPETGFGLRYDKLHRVPFGEYIPGQDSVLAGVVPENFGLSAGKEAVPFDYQSWRFAPLICFEDTVPHVTRTIVNSVDKSTEKPVDVMVNLSNDGWFAGSSEHEQHLITAQFRAIEMRKPLVRAANMGVSAVVDGNGSVLDPEVFLTKDPVNWQPREISFRDPQTGRYRRKLEAVVVQTVPLDSRSSLYMLTGDWFAGICFTLTVVIGLFRVLQRRSRTDRSEKNAAAVA